MNSYIGKKAMTLGDLKRSIVFSLDSEQLLAHVRYLWETKVIAVFNTPQCSEWRQNEKLRGDYIPDEGGEWPLIHVAGWCLCSARNLSIFCAVAVGKLRNVGSDFRPINQTNISWLRDSD